MTRRVVVMLICLICMGKQAATGDTTAELSVADVVRERLRQRIEAIRMSPRTVTGQTRVRALNHLRRFYQQRAYRPAWRDGNGTWLRAEGLLNVLRDAHHDGLQPVDYHLTPIEALLEQSRQPHQQMASLLLDRLVDLDILLTDAFFLYGSHLLTGRVNPVTIRAEWYTAPRKADLTAVLQTALETNRLDEALHRLRPTHPGYAALQDALSHYRALARHGAWAPVSDGPKMQQGDRGPRVLALRQRLLVTDDLAPASQDKPDLFDHHLEHALRRFQQRHGLEPDGVVGPATHAVLNVSAEARVRQIIANLERWRWLSQDLGWRYILVNIADGSLTVVEDQRSVMTMRVIVGKPYRRTPVFSDHMTYLVLNPSWHVPSSIAIQDKLPLIRRDPTYLAKQRIKVFPRAETTRRELDPGSIDWSTVSAEYFPYQLRQEPGPLNALGRVKFMFPNRFNVYLHDTPSRELFAKTVRTFSSGCIRIEKPIDLATYVLQGHPNWTRDTLLAAIARGTEQTVRLPEPIAVHLLYWTAWVDADGTVHFRDDLYDRDKPLINALQKKLGAL